jgi:hypothetical protein
VQCASLDQQAAVRRGAAWVPRLTPGAARFR